MKILVTGANGYLGQGIVKQLLDDGNEVIATDLKNDNIDKRAKIKIMDIFNLDDPYRYFEKPDIVLHLAWRDGFVHNSINHINDLPRHYLFLKKFIEANISQIAVLGSVHEVGFYEGSVNENTPTNPQSLYGISKDALRKAIELECKNHDTVLQWIRGYYIVGNSEFGNSVFSKITQSVKKGKTEFPFTLGLNQFDFIDYSCFCKQTSLIVEQTVVTGIINVCSGRPERLSDRVERFIKENDYHIKLKYGAFPDRPYDSKAIWGDDGKIELIKRNVYNNQ